MRKQGAHGGRQLILCVLVMRERVAPSNVYDWYFYYDIIDVNSSAVSTIEVYFAAINKVGVPRTVRR